MKKCNENKWGDLECLYKACQAAITEGGFFTDTGRLGLVKIWKGLGLGLKIKRLGLAPQGLVYKSTLIHFYTVFLDT